MTHTSTQPSSITALPNTLISLTLDQHHRVVTGNAKATDWFPDFTAGQTRFSESWLANAELQLIDRHFRPVPLEDLLNSRINNPYIGFAFARETRWVQWHQQTTGKQIQLSLIDVTDLMNDLFLLQDANEEANIRDFSTGLYNRRYAMERLEQLYLHAKRYHNTFTIALIDIDHFKRINDTFGHSVGDRVIEQLAAALVRCLRETDICSRYGGEEFLVLMPETDTQEAILSLDRLRQQVSELKWAEMQRPVTISSGVIAWQQNKSIEQLMFLADQRLSTAKKAGRNQVCGDLL